MHRETILPYVLNNNNIIYLGENWDSSDNFFPPLNNLSGLANPRNLHGFFLVDKDFRNITFLKEASFRIYYLSKSFDEKKYLFIYDNDDLYEYNIETNETRLLLIDKDEVLRACNN